MSEKVATFGGDPEEMGSDMAKFNDENGSAKDLAVVEALPNETVRGSLLLWTSGATYADIAHQFKFRSPAVAQMAIERALSESVDDTADRTKLRRRMSLTLDRLLRSVMPKAVDTQNPEQLPAVRTALTVIERYSRLNGLDAPQEVNVNLPDHEKFTQFIEAAARGMNIDVPVEADIFSDEFVYAEVVEDDDEPNG